MSVSTPPSRASELPPVGLSLEARLRRFLAPEPAHDERVRQLAAILRLAVAVVVVVAFGLVDDSRISHRSFGFLVAFVWVPAAGLLDLLSRRFPGMVTDALTLVVDLALGFVVATAVEGSGTAVISGGVLIVAYYAYLRGLIFGLVAAVGAEVALASPYLVDDRLSAFDLVLAPTLFVLAAVLLTGIRGARSNLSGILSRAQERADAILTGVAEAVVVTSPRGRVREWNDAASRALGCEADAAVGTGCAEILRLRRGIETLDCSQGCALLQARLDEADDDLRVWREAPDGERQPFLAHVSPLLDEDGRLVEVVHSFRDITKLVQADEAKTLFLATASHELKTPLTVIMGYSELMLRQSDLGGDAREQGLKAIHERARQLTDIVNRILLSSRIEAGRVELELRPVDVRAPIDESVAGVVAGHGRQVRLDSTPDLPDALVDAHALRTLIDHLLDNAVKYSEADGDVEVGVSFDDRWVAIEVRDHGIGMSPDELGQCFDRFWQAETGDVRRFGGTGIGLYIVKSLAEAMHGEVDVASEPGVGTTFTVQVPRADRPSGPSGEPGPMAPEREPSIIREFMRQAGVGC